MVNHFTVMGVSGCGKSTLARALSEAWGLAYIEGDDLHGRANVAKMSSGVPLTDEDRWPWLDRVGTALTRRPDGAVVSCSALRRVYRDRIRRFVPQGLGIIHLELTPQSLEQRMLRRPTHFMPPTLLESQLRTLERPNVEPNTMTLNGDLSLDQLVANATNWRNSL